MSSDARVPLPAGVATTGTGTTTTTNDADRRKTRATAMTPRVASQVTRTIRTSPRTTITDRRITRVITAATRHTEAGLGSWWSRRLARCAFASTAPSSHTTGTWAQ